MISVVIPHYRGKEKIVTALSQNLPFLKDCEVIVVNDYPHQSIRKEMASRFPSVVLIENKINLGFAGAASVGIRAAKNPFVMLLNDDVILHDDIPIKSVTHFEKNKELFAVSFRQAEKNNIFVGRNRIVWKNGFFQHSAADSSQSGINGWAEGGAMLMDKEKYEKINGFDMLFSPFYWEDIDLSYRAWKAGYEILFDSNVTVEHHHESTISTHFKKSYIQTIAYRNQFITIWKNISDGKMLAEHTLFLLKNLVIYSLKGDFSFGKGFLLAVALLPTILQKKEKQKSMWRMNDRQIFDTFKG